MATRILIYEDNEHLRNSLKALFQYNPEFEVAMAMPNAETVLEDIAQFAPDVVLMDIDMPVVNGVAAVQRLRTRHETLPVIMLTVFEDNDNIIRSICAGANGYLLKKNFDQILPAIRDVLTGGAPMTSTIARKVLQLFPRTRQDLKSEGELLSPREQEILQLLVQGYSYKMIADEAQVSIETVRTHIKKIYKKMQVNSATEAIYKAMKDRLV